MAKYPDIPIPCVPTIKVLVEKTVVPVEQKQEITVCVNNAKLLIVGETKYLGVIIQGVTQLIRKMLTIHAYHTTFK